MCHAWPQAVTLDSPWTATEPTLTPLPPQINPAQKSTKAKITSKRINPTSQQQTISTQPVQFTSLLQITTNTSP